MDQSLGALFSGENCMDQWPRKFVTSFLRDWYWSMDGSSHHLTHTFNSREKKRPKRKFSGRISRGRPGVIRADVPGQKLRAGSRNLGKRSIWVQTSMTRTRGRPWSQGMQKNFVQKNLGLFYRSLFSVTRKRGISKAVLHKSALCAFLHKFCACFSAGHFGVRKTHRNAQKSQKKKMQNAQKRAILHRRVQHPR